MEKDELRRAGDDDDDGDDYSPDSSDGDPEVLEVPGLDVEDVADQSLESSDSRDDLASDDTLLGPGLIEQCREKLRADHREMAIEQAAWLAEREKVRKSIRKSGSQMPGLPVLLAKVDVSDPSRVVASA